MESTGIRPTLEQIEAMAREQRDKRQRAQARAQQAVRQRQAAEEDVRSAMLIEYHLYRAAALGRGQVKFDRFEEQYLRWQTGMRTDTVDVHGLMFDTEKVYELVRFLHRSGHLRSASFDAQTLRMEFPNWVDDLTLVPTDGSTRAALKALAMRHTGITESQDGTFSYEPKTDGEPKFRRKVRADDEPRVQRP